MTEEIAATPGWAEQRLDEAFRGLPGDAAVIAAKRDYLGCLARRKQPGAPSDTLGAEFSACRPALRKSLEEAGVSEGSLTRLNAELETLEAEIAADS